MWIVAPVGSGKSLAIRVLRQRFGSRIVATTARRLCDAAREAKDGLPLLAEVESLDAATDHGALLELTSRGPGVCVMAPFKRVRAGPVPSRWKDFRWKGDNGWRERLVLWSHARLPNPEKLDADAVLDWLDEIDPSGALFQTPGHLLPLLARAYRAGLPRGSRSDALAEVGREALGQVLGANSSPWVRREGYRTVEQLLSPRLARLDLELRPLRTEEWAELLPAGRAAPIVPVRGATRRKQASPVAPAPDAAATSPTSLQSTHLLENLGVLQTTEDGGLDVAPWIRIGIEREAIVREIKSGGAEWPTWAVDHTRKDAVDDALDALLVTVQAPIFFGARRIDMAIRS